MRKNSGAKGIRGLPKPDMHSQCELIIARDLSERAGDRNISPSELSGGVIVADTGSHAISVDAADPVHTSLICVSGRGAGGDDESAFRDVP